MLCKRLGECIDTELKLKEDNKCSNRSVCIQVSDRRSNVKCEENGKRYVLENTKKNHVVFLKVDGGVIVPDKTDTQGISKCDYLFAVGENKECAILTELKGVDVAKAVRQISGTLERYRNVFAAFQHVYGRIVVSSSTPKLKATPEYVKLATRLMKEYNGNVKIFERQRSEKDTELSKA